MHKNWFHRDSGGPHRARHHGFTGTNAAAFPSLTSFPGGSQVRVTGFGDLTIGFLQDLQAYGVLPGRTLKILGRQPLTIILVEQTELALEDSVASQVFVELVDNPV